LKVPSEHNGHLLQKLPANETNTTTAHKAAKSQTVYNTTTRLTAPYPG